MMSNVNIYQMLCFFEEKKQTFCLVQSCSKTLAFSMLAMQTSSCLYLWLTKRHLTQLLWTALGSFVVFLLFCLSHYSEGNSDEESPRGKKLLSGGGKQKEINTERKNMETKGWKGKNGRTTEWLCSANPLGGNVRFLHATTCWVTECFVWSDSCAVGRVKFQCCQLSNERSWSLPEKFSLGLLFSFNRCWDTKTRLM